MIKSFACSLCLLINLAALSSAQESIPAPLGNEVMRKAPFRSTEESQARAGHPLQVAPWARLTYGPDYRGYMVGGGKVPIDFPRRVQADGPSANEGTWGMDYAPWWSRVDLLWSHGQLYQGGTGQYEPDHNNFPFDQRFGRRIRNSE